MEEEVESGLVEADHGLILEIGVREGSPVLVLFPLKEETCWSARMPSLTWIFAFTYNNGI